MSPLASNMQISEHNPFPASTARRSPPEAPSAVFAKRAREIMDCELQASGAIADPLLDADGGASDYLLMEQRQKSSADSGYRRARAGTLPSNLRQDPARYEPEVTPAKPAAFAVPQPTAHAPPRPILRHAASSSTSSLTAATAAANRLRSGSLTLPSNGLTNAFGQSPFSNVWLANPGLTTPHASSPLAQPDIRGILPSLPAVPTARNDFRDLTSPIESNASMTSDDLNFSTLDYLGLADSGEKDDVAPASMSERRLRAQQAIANNGPASRNRASTVSTFARPPFRDSVVPSYSREDEGYMNDETEILMDSLSISGQDIYGSGAYDPYSRLDATSLYAPSSQATLRNFKDSAHLSANRPRAISVGTLDNDRRASAYSEGTYLNTIPQSPVQRQAHPARLSMRSHSDRDLSSRSLAPRHSAQVSRAGTPDTVNGRPNAIDGPTGTHTPQVPTRSLWIGNLDVNATNDALLAVFSQYGAIESLRMLPEKSCAFVNFVDRNDAFKARDDVLNRLGGHLSALSETTPVRIGYGKIDPVPTGASVSPNPPVEAVVPSPPTPPAQQTPALSAATVAAPTAATSTSTPREVSPVKQSNGDESNLPTRALWIGSIPGSTPSSSLLQIFSPFGPVESARVLVAKNCGFVNFERADSAIAARKALNGRDILGSDVGPIKVAFAKVPTKASPLVGTESSPEAAGALAESQLEDLVNLKGADNIPAEAQISAAAGGIENYRSSLAVDLVKSGVAEALLGKGWAPDGATSEQQMIMQVLSVGDEDEERDVRAALDLPSGVAYYNSVPLVSDRGAGRAFDVAHLREVKRRIDSGCPQDEIDNMTCDLLPIAAELASDYVGNTVIQKLCEFASAHLRIAIVDVIAPTLASIGNHKNGTWAAQRLIECASTHEEMEIIMLHLAPYVPALMADGVGNYVVSGCLRFGPPYNLFIFDAIVDRIWDIGQARFGARCMKTILDSPHTPRYQKKRIATGIILNSVPLATNQNGAILLTWLLDSSHLPGRYGLLAHRFAPHIVHLCNHKLASLNVLRIINQKTELGASQLMVRTLFFSANDEVLREVLWDAPNGSQVISKIMVNTSLDQSDKPAMIEATRRVLLSMNASNTSPYRRLMEEVGLPISAAPMNSPNRYPARAPFQHQQPYAGAPYGMNPYNAPHLPHLQGPMGNYMQPHPGSLSPLMIPGGMSFGQVLGGGVQGGSGPSTPVPRPMGSPHGQMMSPGSDPFNPFASPSRVDRRDNRRGPSQQRQQGHEGHHPAFEIHPSYGGLGMQADPSSPPMPMAHLNYTPFMPSPMSQRLYSHDGYPA